MASFGIPMDQTTRSEFTADEFIEWAMQQPGPERYELVSGMLVTMAPERIGHVRAKGAIFASLDASIRAGRLPCEALTDGAGVIIDERTVYEPDALVRCGEPLGDHDTRVADPILVVEVLSPSTQAYDAGAKLEGYFRLPSVRHYILAKTDARAVIHHRREDSGSIVTAIVRQGILDLDPPGLFLDLDAVWAVLQ